MQHAATTPSTEYPSAARPGKAVQSWRKRRASWLTAPLRAIQALVCTVLERCVHWSIPRCAIRHELCPTPSPKPSNPKPQTPNPKPQTPRRALFSLARALSLAKANGHWLSAKLGLRRRLPPAAEHAAGSGVAAVLGGLVSVSGCKIAENATFGIFVSGGRAGARPRVSGVTVRVCARTGALQDMHQHLHCVAFVPTRARTCACSLHLIP